MWINGNFRLQYQDRDVGDALVNLTSTAELKNVATIKVIPVTDDNQAIPVCDDVASTQTDVTELLSSPSSCLYKNPDVAKKVYDTNVLLRH